MRIFVTRGFDQSILSEVNDFATLVNKNEDDMVLEIWHGDKKITAYVGPEEVHVLLVEGEEIQESADLRQSLRWLCSLL